MWVNWEEFFRISNDIKDLISKDLDESALKEIGFSKQNTLLDNGLNLVTSGITTLEEIISITKEE